LGKVGFLTTLGVRVRVGIGGFGPFLTPEVQLDHSLYHTAKLGSPIEMA